MNKLANDDMIEYWNGDGGNKWVRFQERMDVSLKHFGHEVMLAADISAGESVIDIGCGCGDTTHDIAQRVGPSGHAQGIDISEQILARAKAREQSTLESNIAFSLSDVQTHHFEPSVLDLAFSRFGVMFFDDPVIAFSNIRRGLKSGGRVAFMCWQPAKENEWISLALDIVKNHIPLPVSPQPEQPGPLSFGDRNRVMRILNEAGFKNILIENFASPFSVGSNVDQAIDFLTNMGPACGAISQPNVSDTDKSRINAELRERLMPCETEHGITLGAATWIVTAQNL